MSHTPAHRPERHHAEQGDSEHTAGPYPTDPGDTLLYENDRVRVWSMTLGPGETYRFHQHTHDHFVLWPEAGRARAQEAGKDWGFVQRAEPGFVMFRSVGRESPLTPHRLHNLEDHDVTHYIVELLGESPYATTQDRDYNGRGGAEPLTETT
ncbi:hypothetical protein ACN2WE_00755 [Streptomyces sp. cg28]|uniref:hypothetical protein n=1 Tax=Streptomyces sp. cg28 TaxID=3403457 RepID=UPI003B222E25